MKNREKGEVLENSTSKARYWSDSSSFIRGKYPNLVNCSVRRPIAWKNRNVKKGDNNQGELKDTDFGRKFVLLPNNLRSKMLILR